MGRMLRLREWNMGALPSSFADNGLEVSGTHWFGQRAQLDYGASGMYGTLDPDDKLSYLIHGADLTLRVNRTNIRCEYLARREQFDVSDPSRFEYQVPAEGGDFFVKHGAYAEIEQPLTRDLDLVGRVDGLYRGGNVPTASPLLAKSAVLRSTPGTAFTVEPGLRLKLSTELWSFSDRGQDNTHTAMSVHVGAVGPF